MKPTIPPDKFREIKKAITKYFYCDVLDPVHGLSDGIKDNIISTFAYAYDHHLTDAQIQEQLKGTNLSNLLERMRSNNKPFPVRWGELKPMLQEEATSKGISMHSLCREVGRHYFSSKLGTPPGDEDSK